MTVEESDRNELLYKYCNIKKKDRVGVFATFRSFEQWAMEAGYKPGDTLMRHNKEMPHSPENCYFVENRNADPFLGPSRDDWIRRWNRAVNPLRVAAGLEPFPDPVANTEMDIM